MVGFSLSERRWEGKKGGSTGSKDLGFVRILSPGLGRVFSGWYQGDGAFCNFTVRTFLCLDETDHGRAVHWR